MLTPVDAVIATILWQSLSDIGDTLRQSYTSCQGTISGIYVVQRTWHGYDVRWTRHQRMFGSYIHETKHSHFSHTTLGVVEILKHQVFHPEE